MKFEVIASSSNGNAYRLTSDRATLLIECGIDYRSLQKAFDFKLSSIDGCLVTHEHQDHSKSMKDIVKSGISVYTTEGTAEALSIEHYNLIHIKPLKQFIIKDLTILPFSVMHDASDPVGFLIADQKGNKLLFVTDTFYIPYQFKGLTHIAVECNYSEDLLEKNILEGNTPIVLRKRLLRSHFSLENVKEFLKANDLSRVKEIHLLHLSNSNSDEYYFKSEIQKLTGLPIYIAKN